MTLASPTTVTIAGVGHVLSKIREDNFQSVYRKKATNLEINLNIRHTYEGKAGVQNPVERHNAELVYTTFDANGIPTTWSAYIVLRTPQSLGATPVIDLMAGLSGWLTASTNANLTSIANWES
jgi:hypothetical protein